MLINKAEILKLNLLSNTNDANFGAVAYDLSAAEIVTLENKIVESYNLPPQGMVVVVSKEEFNLENQCVVGFTTVKNTLSRKGIMAVNVGLVDPGYTGAISSILMNFGKSTIKITKGDTFLRMTFHKFEPLDSSIFNFQNQTTLHKDYVEQRKNEANVYLDPTFLYLNDVLHKASDSAKVVAVAEAKALIDNFKGNFEYILKMGALVIGVLGITIAAIFNILNYRNSRANEILVNSDIKLLEKRIQVMQDSFSKIVILKDTTKR